MATTTHRATEADLWEHSAKGLRCELVDGEIRAMSPAGGRHGNICIRIAVLLGTHVRDRALGVVFDSSTGFRLPNGNVRAPDVAFVASERMETIPVGFVPLAPDLAIEVQSPGDNQRELLDKVGEYLQAGTRLVWVVDPEARTVTVYRSATDVRCLQHDEELDGGDVLPAFRCRPADLF